MEQFFGQLSLLHGWLPPTVQGLALLMLVAAIHWRAAAGSSGCCRRRWSPRSR
ncbi:hypothetical protein I549_0702 [Mycobacterium avium subsp. avium 2285 (R)]|nr:hypothetical protein I549_0702 [Mycobacterium avium subsp. avium 2285 (R)]